MASNTAPQYLHKVEQRTVQKVQAQEVKPPEPVAPAPVAPAPEPVVERPRVVAPSYSGSHQDWMTQAGINPNDFGAVDYIISHESGWRPDARNSIGCLGLAQACPGSKILNACPDLNPVCQLQWASSYANSRYGGWQGAYSFWLSNHWW